MEEELIEDLEALDAKKRARRYEQAVRKYCDDLGLSRTQYERELYLADQGLRPYPSAEYINPDRELQYERAEQAREERSRGRSPDN